MDSRHSKQVGGSKYVPTRWLLAFVSGCRLAVVSAHRDPAGLAMVKDEWFIVARGEA